MDESADGRRILTAVPQDDWKRPTGRPLLLAGHYEEQCSLLTSHSFTYPSKADLV